MPLNSISDWIQPQHLTSEAIAHYSGVMASNPEKIVVIDDFLFDRHIRNFQELMEKAGRKELIYGLPGDPPRVSREKWLSVPEEKRFYTFLEVSGPNSGYEMSEAYLTHLLWRAFLKSQQFFDFIFEISGLKVNSVDCVNAKEFAKGHFLREHCDTYPNRKIEFVLGFSSDWKREYGGQFLFFRNENSVWKQSADVEYKYNRMLMFVPMKGFFHAASPRTLEAEDVKRWNYTVFFSQIPGKSDS
ncbi:MAG: 2OG-Fe(II) oxygenase [Candidatus Riflebacteria bacterium]|nr:2OG-Fe(II) oxygenase [Candidatus Riflebacteria bacterium]